MLKLRTALVPTAKIGTGAGMWIIVGGFIFGLSGLVTIGMMLYSGVLAFQVVTLPVEYDASARAKELAVSSGIVTEHERAGMDRVLNAAALTYVAAALTTLLTLLYFFLRRD
jgi:Zn-dependent membrane protease YugP